MQSWVGKRASDCAANSQQSNAGRTNVASGSGCVRLSASLRSETRDRSQTVEEDNFTQHSHWENATFPALCYTFVKIDFQLLWCRHFILSLGSVFLSAPCAFYPLKVAACYGLILMAQIFWWNMCTHRRRQARWRTQASFFNIYIRFCALSWRVQHTVQSTRMPQRSDPQVWWFSRTNISRLYLFVCNRCASVCTTSWAGGWMSNTSQRHCSLCPEIETQFYLHNKSSYLEVKVGLIFVMCSCFSWEIKYYQQIHTPPCLSALTHPHSFLTSDSIVSDVTVQ